MACKKLIIPDSMSLKECYEQPIPFNERLLPNEIITSVIWQSDITINPDPNNDPKSGFSDKIAYMWVDPIELGKKEFGVVVTTSEGRKYEVIAIVNIKNHKVINVTEYMSPRETYDYAITLAKRIKENEEIVNTVWDAHQDLVVVNQNLSGDVTAVWINPMVSGKKFLDALITTNQDRKYEFNLMLNICE